MPLTGDKFYDLWHDMVIDAMCELGDAPDDSAVVDQLRGLAVAWRAECLEYDDDAWAA